MIISELINLMRALRKPQVKHSCSRKINLEQDVRAHLFVQGGGHVAFPPRVAVRRGCFLTFWGNTEFWECPVGAPWRAGGVCLKLH